MRRVIWGDRGNDKMEKFVIHNLATIDNYKY